MLSSSSIKSRVADLHAAFADDSVDAILATIGGFNSNELLPYIDYDLIAKHPKIICGYSDSTAFLNAIFAKTGNLTYMGPSYSSFKMKEGQDYQIKAWLNAMTKSAYDLVPSQEWFKRPLVRPNTTTPFYANRIENLQRRESFWHHYWWKFIYFCTPSRNHLTPLKSTIISFS